MTPRAQSDSYRIYLTYNWPDKPLGSVLIPRQNSLFCGVLVVLN